jgi:hypothetical protein
VNYYSFYDLEAGLQNKGQPSGEHLSIERKVSYCTKQLDIGCLEYVVEQR